VGNWLTTAAGLTLSGSSVLVASPSTSATIVGNVVYASSSNSTYSGAISGSASVLTLAAPANTILTLSNSTPDAFGGTVVQSGTLKLANSAALAGGNMTVNGGRLDMNGLNLLFAELEGTGGTVSTSQTGTVTLTVSPAINTSPHYGGSITNGSGKVALLKTGPGTLVLSGSNAYSGGTVVTQGILEIMTPGGLRDGSSLTVGNTLAFGASVVPEVAINDTSSSPALAAVPEPGTLALIAVALVGLGLFTVHGRIGG